MAGAKRSFQRLIRYMAQPKLCFYCLIWLMVVLVIGTIAQRDLGLYVAQNRFFSSMYFWAGAIPLPGGYPVMALLFVGVLARLVDGRVWVRQKIGVNLVHLGALLLLGGGFLTAIFSFEGNMLIGEGGSADYLSDYHITELVFVDKRPADHDQITSFSRSFLHNGKSLEHPNLPFRVEILKVFRNAEPRQRPAPAEGDSHGFAKNFEFAEMPLDPEAERNRAGIMFRVSGASPAEVNGQYMLMERMPVAQTLQIEGGRFEIDLRRLRTPLPFRLELTKFDKQMHPGTEVAASYRSDLILHDGDLHQPVRVQMNEPLRYKGYTFYQASFVEGGAGTATVLAVVHNVGRIFPYVSGIVMCIGLLIHLMANLPKLFRPEGGVL